MNINVRQLSTGNYAVAFPFALKDNFKATFKSAKWNRDARVWEVGPRSKKKLDQWVAEVQGSGVVEAIEAEEAAEMSERDLEDLRSKLAGIKHSREQALARIGDLKATREAREKLLEELKAAEADLAEAQAAAQAETEAVKAREKEIDEILGRVIDIDAVHDAAETMAKTVGYNRPRFNEAQGVISQARSALAEAGYELAALEILCDANYNRPDRDHPKHMRDDAWYRLAKIEDQD